MSEGNITMDLTEVNEEVDEQPLVSAPEEEEPEEVPEESEEPVVEEPEEVPEEPVVEEPEEVPEEEPVVEEPAVEEEPVVSEEPVVEEPEEVPEPEPLPEVPEPEPCLGDEIIVECGIHQGKTFTEVLPLLYGHYENADDVKVWIGKAPINGNDKLNALKYLDIWISENQ